MLGLSLNLSVIANCGLSSGMVVGIKDDSGNIIKDDSGNVIKDDSGN